MAEDKCSLVQKIRVWTLIDRHSCEKIGPIHLTLLGHTAGWQADK